MPKLLLVSTVPAFIRGFLLGYARHFRAAGWHVAAAAQGITAHQDCRRAFDDVFDVDWSRSPLEISKFLAARHQIRTIVTRSGYDIVHVHTPIAGFITRFALRARRGDGLRVIYTAHGFHFHPQGSAPRNWMYRNLEKAAGHWTDYLVVINRADAEAALKYSIIPPLQLRYMPGIGVDTNHYRRSRIQSRRMVEIRQELGLDPGHRLFVMIAEFNAGKRHRDAIEALSRMDRPDIHVAFAGVGPLEQEMQLLSTQLNVSSRVHFLGFRVDIPELILASTGTLLPSVREGLPRSILESLSLGVPVIGTDIRGIRDLIADGAGLLVKTGDVNGLATAMAKLADDPDLAGRLGENGRERVQAYDIEYILRLHEDLYAEALGTPSSLRLDQTAY